MTYKELKEKIALLPDNEEVNFELQRNDGEIINMVFKNINTEYNTVELKEDFIMLEDLMKTIEKQYV